MTQSTDTVALLNTEIAAFGIWDSESISSVITADKHQALLSQIFTSGVPELANKCFIFSTGSDGAFQITIRRNQGLPSDETSLVTNESLGFGLSVRGKVFLGDPQYMGSLEPTGLQLNMLDSIDLHSGEYIVNAYSIVTRTTSGDPEYHQFILCIYDKVRYPSDKPHQKFSKVVDFSFSTLSDAEIAEQQAQALLKKQARTNQTAIAKANRTACEAIVTEKVASQLRAELPANWKTVRFEITFALSSSKSTCYYIDSGVQRHSIKSPVKSFDTFYTYDAVAIQPEVLWSKIIITLTRRLPIGKGKVHAEFMSNN